MKQGQIPGGKGPGPQAFHQLNPALSGRLRQGMVLLGDGAANPLLYTTYGV